jgi:subtilisin family serine protease
LLHGFFGLPPDPLYQAIAAYLPFPADFVPIFGQAPSAKIYPVKVFDVNGEDTPTSVILKGLDHILTLKKKDLLDIDVVNLSFGGPTVYDGRGAFDRFVREMTMARMLVVASAGNGGPILNSIGTPGSAVHSIAVGALDYAISCAFSMNTQDLPQGLMARSIMGMKALV